jgi:hypothetical protein
MRRAKHPEVTLTRHNVSRDGYTRDGKYYGYGAPIFYAFNEETGAELEFRAGDAKIAREFIRRMFEDPNAEVFRDGKRFQHWEVKRFVEPR